VGAHDGIPLIVTGLQGTNPPYPTSNGTRGFYRGVAMAQSLPEACDSVTNADGSSRQPTDPADAKDLSPDPLDSPESGHVIEAQ
jgi:hypothetical protein